MIPSRRSLPTLVVALALVAGCDDRTSFEFRAEGLSATTDPNGAYARNDALELRFNAQVDDHGLATDSVRVSDRDGRPVPFRIAARHDALRLEPVAPEGWPTGGPLLVEIPYPPLGRPLRSRDGAPVLRGFSAQARISEGYAKREGPLRLSSRDLVQGLRETSQDDVFRFECDGPLDPATLAGAVRIVRVGSDVPPRDADVRLLAADRLAVAPFRNGGFVPGARYRLEFASTLRARDGRRPAANAAWTFVAAEGAGGAFVTDFRPEDLEDPALKPAAGPLRPIRRTSVASAARRAADAAGVAFGAGGFRLQTFIPPEAFGGEDALIERLLVPVAVSGGVETLVSRLEVRLGAFAAGDAPSDVFDENWRGSAPPCALDDAPDFGPLSLRVEADGRVELRLATPYLHRAFDAAQTPLGLLVEIAAGPGVAADAPLLGLLGDRGFEGRRSLVADDADARRGRPADVVPAVEVVASQYAPVVLRPWSTDLPAPRYVERPESVVGRGRPYEDFTVEYRALTPSAFGGEPVDATPWSPHLASIQGRPVVQARVVFHPRPRQPGRSAPEIERLSLPFVAER